MAMDLEPGPKGPLKEEWQSIESAPTDILILLWGKYWSDSQGMMQEPLVGHWSGRRWEVYGPGGRFGIRPTLWRPIPTLSSNDAKRSGSP